MLTSEADTLLHTQGKLKSKCQKKIMTVLATTGTAVTTDDPQGDDGGPCKWGPFQPLCCQRFRTPKWVLFWMCWVATLQGIIATGLVNATVTSIERRFDISSTESGTIISCYQITAVIFLLPVSYFGGLGIKPRYIAVGIFTLGLGSVLLSLPHFTTGLYTFDVKENNVCNVDGNVTSLCDVHDGGVSNYKYMFIAAQLLLGAGGSPVYTVGVTYLDDNLPQRSTSLYVGIFYAFVIVGAAIGYLAGGEFLNTWTDFWAVDTSSLSITPDNRRWVGAWWLGFIISGCIAIFVAIPISGFPRSLPGASRYKKEKEDDARKENTIDNGEVVCSVTEPERGTPKKHSLMGASRYKKEKEDDARNENTIDNGEVVCSVTEPERDIPKKHSLMGIWHSMRQLLTNPTFMFISLVAAAESLVTTAFSAFGPKFLESQFSLPAARASQYIGFAAVPAGAGGTFLGGYLVKRFNPAIPSILKWCIAANLVTFILSTVFLINCGNIPFAGINVDYQNNSDNIEVKFLGQQLDNQCNANCGCREEDYHPVCGRDGIMYFSPCYAGCRGIYQEDTELYSNCSCINSNETDYQAEFTSCESDCIWLPVFLPIFALIIFLLFFVTMPSLTVTLRCVPKEQRSFALGIQYVMLRCLGSIPGPIIFGRLIDQSCLLWHTQCEEDGSCLFHDNRSMSYYFMAAGIVVKVASTIFFFLTLMFYKKLPTTFKNATDSNISSQQTTNKESTYL